MKLLVTGSSGLIGSEVVAHFQALGWQVTGFDNNMRRDFFGPEGDTRWNKKRMEPDQSKHSVFGASKVAGDVMVQEYGRYVGLRTCCMRGGCLTGPAHSGVELHGFLSYLVKCNLTGKEYAVYGYQRKQVRDNIHAHDVARCIEFFYRNPSAERFST